MTALIEAVIFGIADSGEPFKGLTSPKRFV
jgi:hypothetical protein